MCRIVCLVSLGIAVCYIHVGSAADDPKPDDQAKAVVAKLVEAYKSKKLDAVLEVVAIPYFDDDLQQGVIKDQDELKKFMGGVLEVMEVMGTNPDKVPADIIRILPYDKARETLGRENSSFKSDEKWKLADEVLAKNDRVVLVGKDGRVEAAILVRIRDGKAKVVGWWD